MKAFTLPLNPLEFRSALATGHGRALLHVQQYGVRDVLNQVIEAALHNQAYDPQCEGSRTDWIRQFLDEEAEQVLLARLVALMAERTGSLWDTLQHCELCLGLARDGLAPARDALYEAFRVWPDSDDLVAVGEILELDGPAGFRELVRRLHRSELGKNRDALWQSLTDHYDSRFGEGSADVLLNEELLDNPLRGADIHRGVVRNLGNLFLNVDAGASHAKRMRDISVDAVIHEISESDPEKNRHWFSSWAGYADDTALLRLFARLGAETNPGRICKYLRVFSRRRLPEVTSGVVALADHPNEDVRFVALQALSQLRHPLVRQLALRCVRQNRWRQGEVSLFAQNFQAGDENLLSQLYQIPDDAYDHHRLITDLVEVCSENRQPRLLDAMLFVYETSPCSNCRADVVKIMQGLDVFPDWAAAEYRRDSNQFGWD